MGNFDQVYRRSIDDKEGFWREAAQAISWYREPTQILDNSNPPFVRWFSDGELNTCYNALDRHVEGGRADQLALIYDSPVTGGTVRTFTYRELRDRVALFAGALKGLGVGKGDTVVIYMPMVPEAAVAMLACARLGAIHSVVFGGFAPNELAVRIDDAKPKVLISASCGIEVNRIIPYKGLVDQAVEQARHKPERCVFLQRKEHIAELGERDVDWDDIVDVAVPADCVPLASTDPLYILYTSGTTGGPKGVVRDNGGHAVALQWTMGAIYNIQPGETWWAASDVGWVVGHSYIVYAPLLTGCASVLYEGKPVGTPDPSAFWRVISTYGVKSLFTAPTAFRAIKKEDPEGKYLKGFDMSKFKVLFLAGERTDPDTYFWATDMLGVPVVDHWWQTETGWAIAANCVGVDLLPIKAGSPTKPVPGWDVTILDGEGNPTPPKVDGAIVVREPLPPGTLMTLWQNDERFVSSYFRDFPGHYLTGDGGHIDEDGYLFIMGRTDDVINVAGHRLSTGSMEEVLATHRDVAECAVVGMADDLKGQVPIGFVVLKAGIQRDPAELRAELVQMVRDQIGAVASFKDVTVVDRLPKTRSGKVLRATMRNIADHKEYKVPSTIEDAAVLAEIEAAVARLQQASRA